jgi:hypothetical protein
MLWPGAYLVCQVSVASVRRDLAKGVFT